MSEHRLDEIKKNIKEKVSESKSPNSGFVTCAILQEILPHGKTKIWQVMMTIPGAFQSGTEWLVAIEVLAKWLYDKEMASILSKK